MTRRARYAARRGISMMEVAVGTLLVGGVLATTIELIGPTVRSTVLAGDRQLARTLADELLDEIANMPFGEPDGDTGVIGRDAGETPSKRSNFDDLDDYDGWIRHPQQRDGTALAGFDGSWQCSVEVRHVVLFSPQTTSASLTNAKRVTVRVKRSDVLLAERSIVRTKDFNAARKPR